MDSIELQGKFVVSKKDSDCRISKFEKETGTDKQRPVYHKTGYSFVNLLLIFTFPSGFNADRCLQHRTEAVHAKSVDRYCDGFS